MLILNCTCNSIFYFIIDCKACGLYSSEALKSLLYTCNIYTPVKTNYCSDARHAQSGPIRLLSPFRSVTVNLLHVSVPNENHEKIELTNN